MSLNRFQSRAFAAMCLTAAVSMVGCTSHDSTSKSGASHTAATPSAMPSATPSTKPAVASTPTPAVAASPTPAAAEKAPAVALPTIRVDAGSEEAITDSQGVKWSADTGSEGGDVQDRADLEITGTKTPELYRTERYGMDAYSFKVPNGDYTVKLHFSEDYDGITSEDDRKFTYEVKDGTAAAGKSLKKVAGFSPWKAAGAQFKAYVDTIPVTVTNGQITITFTPEVENTQINALEIVPR